jgi:hypothetical protein
MLFISSLYVDANRSQILREQSSFWREQKDGAVKVEMLLWLVSDTIKEKHRHLL